MVISLAGISLRLTAELYTIKEGRKATTGTDREKEEARLSVKELDGKIVIIGRLSPREDGGGVLPGGASRAGIGMNIALF